MKRLSAVLVEIGRAHAADLNQISADVRAAADRESSVADAVAIVRAAISSGALSTAEGQAMEEALRVRGPASRAYRDRVRTVGERCLSLQDPIVAEAHLGRAQLASDDNVKIRRAFLRLGGRRPGIRFRIAKWLTDLDNKMQDLDRKLRVHEDEKKEPSADVSAKRNKTNSKEGLFVLLMAVAMLGGFACYVEYQAQQKDKVIAAEDISLQSGKTIPAGAKGTRSDTPCRLIDKTVGVSVLFQRDGKTPVETCVRESMITR